MSYEYEALYTIENLNYFMSKGWELVGNPTSSTHPDTNLPATCWTVRKPVKKELPKKPGNQTVGEILRDIEPEAGAEG